MPATSRPAASLTHSRLNVDTDLEKSHRMVTYKSVIKFKTERSEQLMATPSNATDALQYEFRSNC